MHIAHVALWTCDLERCKRFYTEYFAAVAGPHYRNPAKGFESCFLSFPEGGRLEVMKTTTLNLVSAAPGAQRLGIAHLAIAVGPDERVDVLTRRIRDDGYPVVDGPRRTGDAYYEAVVIDPDGNRIEITASLEGA